MPLYSQLSGSEIFINSGGDTLYLQAIQLTEVYSAMESVSQKIEVIRTKSQISQKIIQLDSIAKQAIIFLDEEEKRINEFEGFTNAREISDQQKVWKEYHNKIKRGQEPVIERSQLLNVELESVKIELVIWELTKKAGKEQNASKEMLSRINYVIDEYDGLKEELKKKQNYIFSLQNQLTDMLIRVDAVISFLEKAKLDIHKRYFIADSPPMWRWNDSTLAKQEFSRNFFNPIIKNYNLIKNYLPHHINSFYIQIIIFLLLSAFFIFLKRKIKSRNIQPDDGQLQNVIFVTNQYITSALLLSFISDIWLFPNAPIAFRELLQLIILVPTFILLRGLISSKLQPYLYTILVLFLADKFHLLFELTNLESRILLIIESAVGLWLIYKIRSPRGNIRSHLEGKWWKRMLRLSSIFALFLIVAIITSVIGYFNLSLLLVRTAINALFMGVMISVLVILLLSILHALLVTGLLEGSNIIKKYRLKVLSRVASTIQILGFIVWLRSVFISMGMLDYVVQWALDFLNSSWEVGSVTISLGSFIAFFAAIIVTFIVSRSIRVLLEDEIFARIKLPRGVPGAISMLVGYFIVGIGIYIAISAAGVDLGKFGLIAGALGVGIGFGLQNVVYHFISGLILAFERPVQVGDTIEVGTLLGRIKSIGVRSSTIKTYDGSEVIVPNGNFISNEVINWTLSDRKSRKMIPVSVAYGSNPREVLDLIYKAASDHDEVLKNPEPWALFDGFGESSLNFRIYFWMSYDRGMSIKSEVAMNIYDALQEANIHIPYPQQDLHIKSIESNFEDKLVSKPKKKNRKTDQQNGN
ncbi:MAG: mechanosensitive ion channel [Bacteroidales bacterium]|nr:mechanosensitive ion channel [Bacteroidales bacterium]